MNNHTTTSADDVRVILTGDGEWRGTFAEFVRDNQDSLTLREIQEAADELQRGERWTSGGGAAPKFTLRREPTAFEIIQASRAPDGGWNVPALPGFGIRMLTPGVDIVRAGDFGLTTCTESAALEVAYEPESAWGKVAPVAHFAEHTKHFHVDLLFRYTREVWTGDESRHVTDVSSDEVLGVLDAQNERTREAQDEIAAVERRHFGEAIARYRVAMDAGATEETLRAMRCGIDQLMGQMKYASRGGIWWDAKHGTWGLGTLEEDDLDAMAHGGVVTGPHC